MRALYLVPLCALALLPGCTTPLAPVDVTRFHAPVVPQAETVALVPAVDINANSIEYRTYANAVAAALARTGFTVVESGKPAALTATVDFDISIQRPYDPRQGKNPVSVGVGGATGSYGSGLGVGIGIDLSGPPKAQIATRLSVQIRRNLGGDALWEGRAETRAREGTPAAQPAMAAGKLADAMFRGYPGQSGETITVK